MKDNILRGEPEKSLQQWNEYKTDPNLTWERCYTIHTLLSTVKDELILTKAQDDAVFEAMIQAYGRLSEITSELFKEPS